MDFNIEECNIIFPDASHYDMNKPGDMALYLAHMELYPFKSVIQNSELSLYMVDDAYKRKIDEAHLDDDWATIMWAISKRNIHVSKVNLLTQYSLLVTLVSLFEDAVNTLCRIYYEVKTIPVAIEQIKGEGIERACNYLKTYVGIKNFKEDKQWEYVSTIVEARHMVVHNGGRISKKLEKFDKFGIGYRKEDRQIYLEHGDIIKMYCAILDFMDRAFRIKPVD